MIAMTTNSSMSVNPRKRPGRAAFRVEQGVVKAMNVIVIVYPRNTGRTVELQAKFPRN
jgi:hypothetical protein